MRKYPFFVGIGSAGQGWALGAGALGASAGYIDYNHCVYDSISHAGIARFHSSTIQGSSYVAGSVTGSDTIFNGSACFIGYIDLENCTFDSHLSLVSPNTTLRRCATQSINISCESSFIESKNLYLYDGTIVNGDVIFRGGVGRVHLQGGSQVLGRIIGAEVINDDQHYQNRF